ncbi:hypothetical protein BGZ60DRAFT_413601 [Tricladium varicosporioides]|nr:hypothetical protein BGZ60DRAFT_413601 [Hymenoscyphus varicosporioides]
MARNSTKNPTSPSFPWEFPVPNTPFWQDLPYPLSRNFFQAFTTAELAAFEEAGQFPTDEKFPKNAKVELLETLLQLKLGRFPKSAGPDVEKADYGEWTKVTLALLSAANFLHNSSQEEELINSWLTANSKFSPENKSPHRAYADLLVRQGKYLQAIPLYREVLSWMQTHPILGLDAPQTLGCMRGLAGALIKCGRGAEVEEGEKMIGEMGVLAGGMEEGRFGEYKGMEEELLAKFIEEMSVWRKG